MRVVVTRPQPQGDATAERLRALGHVPIIAPLTRTIALPGSLPDLTGIRAVAATSANAFRHAGTALTAHVRHLPVLTVGDRTAEAARNAGFADIRSADGDVGALLTLARETTAGGLLYLAGHPRRADFELGLQQDDRAVTTVEIYETLPIVLNEECISVFQGAEAILVFSQSAALALAGVAVGGAIVCMSSRVAGALDQHGVRIIIAERPTEASMLAALDRV